MGDKDILERQIAIRLAQVDFDRLDALVARIPVVSRNAIARAALRLGIGFLEEDPARILKQLPSGRAKRGRR